MKSTVLQLFAKLICFIVIFVVVAISLGPFLWLLFSSLMDNQDIITGNMTFANGIHLENYVTAFTLAPITQFFMNSVVISTAATCLNLLVCLLAAYVVARFDFPGKSIVSLCFASVLFVPCAALLQPIFMTMADMNLLDNKLSLILVYAGLGLASSYFIIFSYLRTVPVDLEEAAAIDGAGFFTTFFRIVMPIARPCLATAGVLEFLLCWNEFTFAMVLTTGNSARTLPIALYYFLNQFSSDYGALFAATVIVALPSVIIFVVLQKQVIEGLAAGSVKG